jgi:hypothetical protein
MCTNIGRVEVPPLSTGYVELDYGDGLEAYINGTGPYRVGFDTGQSAPLHFTAAGAAGLDLPVVGSSPVGDGSGENAITADIVQVDAFVIGGHRFDDVTGIVFDGMPGTGDGGNINFGFPLFADRLFTLDVGAERIVLEHGTLDPEDPDVVPFTMPRGLSRVQVTIPGLPRPAIAVVDSGSPGALTVPTFYMDHLTLADEPVVVGRMATMFNEFEIQSATLDGDLVIGRQRIVNPKLTFTEHLPDVILGRDAMRHLVLTFDQANKLVRVLPAGLDRSGGVTP